MRLREPATAPDPSVLFYQRVREDGRVEVATMQTISRDEKADAWRGLFLIPGHAPYFMDQYTSELDQWEPVYALTQSDLAGIVERVAQRVVEILGTKKTTPAKIVEAGMKVTQAETVQAAVEVAVEATKDDPSLLINVLDLGDEEDAPSRKKPVSCPHCEKTYKRQDHYVKHLMKAHGVSE